MKKIVYWIVVVSTVVFTAFVAGCMVVTQPIIGTNPSSQLLVSSPINAAQLEKHVKTLSVDFYPRNVSHPKQLNQAADYIALQLKSAGLEVTHQYFTVDGTQYRNIIAQLPTNHLYGNQPIMVVGAHYDSHDITPGADDNASGVAGLLELAQALVKHPPKRAVQLVAYTNEEPPFFRTEYMGSAQHVKYLQQQNIAVNLMLSLEMIGYFSNEPNSQYFPVGLLRHIYPTQGNFIALVGNMHNMATVRKVKSILRGANGLPVYSINAPVAVQGIDFSDHLNYWQANIPALMVTDTSFNRNLNYHKAADTYEKLNYRKMAQVVEGVFEVVRQYDAK